MLHIQIEYTSFIVCITGKMHETIETNAKTIRELIQELGKEYEGFEDIFIPEDDEFKELKSVIYLRRKNKPPQGVVDLEFKLQDSDIFLFW